MLKTATTIDKQIEILVSRGMIINNIAKAKENLLDIGYFRLGFYWFPFEKSYPRKSKRDHLFKENTTFEDVIQLYYFDFDLRNIFLKYITRIEINLRNAIIYKASNEYLSDPFWYVNPKFMNKNFLNNTNYQNALKNLTKEKVIKNDLLSHKRPYSPAWKCLEFMNFGNIILLYNNIIDGKLRREISLMYGMGAPSQFYNYIDTIRILRNACAHGKVLFDLKLPTPISNGPLGYLGNKKSSLYGAYLVFKYLLGKISKNRVAEMTNDIKNAFSRITSPQVLSIILNNTDFDLNNL